MIYLDSAATTRTDPEVVEAMMPYLTDDFGNPNAMYGFGRRAYCAVERARAQVAEFIGASPHQIIFTSGGSEANSTVFGGLASRMKEEDKRRVITGDSEHTSVLNAAKALCRSAGFSRGLLKTGEYGVSETALRHLLDEFPDTGLVSVMHTNNETGIQNPVEDIGALCRRRGVLFHTDCVQAAGCFELDVDRLNCDFLSLSAHKIHGPKGAGALFARKPGLILPLIHGSESQEFGLRGGTQNVAAVVGFGQACVTAKREFKRNAAYVCELKQLFYGRLVSELETRHLLGIFHINGAPPVHQGKILNLRFDGTDGETLIMMAESKGVYISAGSACHGLEQKPSRILLALGLSEEEARNSVRISFSRMNTREEVETAAAVIAECVSMLYGNKIS